MSVIKRVFLPIFGLSLMLTSCTSSNSIEGAWQVIDFSVSMKMEDDWLENAKAMAIQYKYKFDSDGTVSISYPESLAQNGDLVDRLEDGSLQIQGTYSMPNDSTLYLMGRGGDTATFGIEFISNYRMSMSQDIPNLGVQTFTLDRM
ncbi:MAG: hypothetical protein EP346_10685 [Bacteroidetes bacterium]|nr:MAG: hypothetical protein EP346_10685 [Bacteroidota bacterium]